MPHNLPIDSCPSGSSSHLRKQRLDFLGLSMLLASIAITACAATSSSGKASDSPAGLVSTTIHSSEPMDPRASYHFMRGNLAEIQQDYAVAIREYQAALMADSSSNLLKTKVASLYFAMGDVNNALLYADQVSVEDVGDAQTLAHLAGIYTGAGKPDQALRLYSHAILVDPEKSELYFAKGLLLINLKRYPEAEHAFREGLKITPDAPMGHYYLGRLALEARRPEQATAEFERAIEINPSFEQAYLALGALYESHEETDKAVAVYRRYLRGNYPHSREMRQQLIRVFLQGRAYQEALHELEELIVQDPSDLDVQLRISLVYGEMKEYPKAIEKLKHILRERPGELRVRDYLAMVYEENKQLDQAALAYEENLRIDPTYYDSHLHYGFLLYREKRWPDAASHLVEAVRLNPKQPDGHLLLGLTYLQAEQFELASQAFEQGIRFHPANADLHFNLGTVYDKMDRFEDVVRAMETTLQLDPRHADALNYLGYSYAERGIRIEEAVSLTQRAVALKPNNGYYVDSLGWAFFKKGDVAEALIEIKKAAALVGDDPVIYEHLGEIYLKQERLAEAREAWLRSLELDPNNIKLMERFRGAGLGDPSREERIQQAKRRVSEKMSSQHSPR